MVLFHYAISKETKSQQTKIGVKNKMSESDRRLRISDLYNAIDRAIHHFKEQWQNDDLEIGTEDYFKALDSAISDIEVDSGLSDARRVWKEILERENQERLKKIRGF